MKRKDLVISGYDINSEDDCLKMIFDCRFSDEKHCPNCSAEFKYHRVKGRKCFECARCGHQIYPMVGTMFFGTKTPLKVWFAIIRDFLKDHRGFSARQISFDYGLSYKTAWRICHRIRMAIPNTFKEKLQVRVEIDETFVGGKRKLIPGTDEKGIGDKFIVFGLIERKGEVRMFHIVKKDAKTIRPLIYKHVEIGTVIHHDNNGSYGKLGSKGYWSRLVGSKKYERFKRGIHNNNIETLWSRFKRHLLSTYGWASAKHLQKYLDEFCFRHNTRGNRLSENYSQIVKAMCHPLR